jgi:hypothetical protein
MIFKLKNVATLAERFKNARIEPILILNKEIL